MANEIKLNGWTVAVNVYAVIENTAGQLWRNDTNVWEAYLDADWPYYAIVLTQQGSGGRYRANFPAAITTSGLYNVALYQRVGTTPAYSDTYASTTTVEWTGLGVASAGKSWLDFTQSIPTSNTGQTTGDALNGARAQAFGKWVLSGINLSLYAADGVTIVRTFTLDSSTSPSQRV